MLLSTGERISCALCAMAIHDMGHEAISLTGSQAGIVTDSSHTKARIIDVRADRIQRRARGGPDRPRRRLPGRLDRQPRRHHARPRRLRHDRGRPRRRARRRASARSTPTSPASSAPTRGSSPTPASCRRVSFEEMLEMSASGAGVLQLRSVEYAPQPRRPHPLPQQLRGRPRYPRRSRGRDRGATLRNRRDPLRREARVTLTGVRDEPGVAGRIFTALAEANVNVDVIIQNEPVGDDELADLSFTVDRSDLTTATDTIAALGDVSARGPHRRADRQGLDRRRRHALAPRRRRQGLRGARRARGSTSR